MSAARDKLNRQGLPGLLGMLGGKLPSREQDQPLQAAAVAGAQSDAFPVDLIVAVGSLNVGDPYYHTGSTWASLDSSIATRALAGVCVSSGDDASTIRLLGLVPRSGTTGDVLWVDAAGALTTTYPGDETDETTGAPWVWEIGWQVDATHALIVPTCPYRPRLVRFCVDGGETALTVTVREYPADP